MKVVYRYRTAKPENGHFSLQLHADATILSFAEHWHTEKGWEVCIDALEDSTRAKERRYFFLCNAGDSLDFIDREHPDLYYLGTQSSKSYCSYLFDTTHLSETEREQGKVERSRYARRKPDWDDMSRTERERERAKVARGTPPGPPKRHTPTDPPTAVGRALRVAGVDGSQ